MKLQPFIYQPLTFNQRAKFRTISAKIQDLFRIYSGNYDRAFLLKYLTAISHYFYYIIDVSQDPKYTSVYSHSTFNIPVEQRIRSIKELQRSNILQNSSGNTSDKALFLVNLQIKIC